MIISLRESKEAGEKVKELAENGTLKSCTVLDLEYAYQVEDETLSVIGKHALELQHLNLNACQDCTDEGLVELSKGCTSLTKLSLYWNVKYTHAGISAIARANTGLQSLSLSGCKLVSDDAAAVIAQSCTGLTELDLTRCVTLTDEALSRVSCTCRSLTTLLLYASAAPADAGLQAVLRELTLLQVLDICGSSKLSDAAFEPLATGPVASMASLRRLNLGWCCKLGDGTLAAVARGCPGLQYLYLLGNKEMTMEGLRDISGGCPALCGLDICGLCQVIHVYYYICVTSYYYVSS